MDCQGVEAEREYRLRRGMRDFFGKFLGLSHFNILFQDGNLIKIASTFVATSIIDAIGPWIERFKSHMAKPPVYTSSANSSKSNCYEGVLHLSQKKDVSPRINQRLQALSFEKPEKCSMKENLTFCLHFLTNVLEKTIIQYLHSNVFEFRGSQQDFF